MFLKSRSHYFNHFLLGVVVFLAHSVLALGALAQEEGQSVRNAAHFLPDGSILLDESLHTLEISSAVQILDVPQRIENFNLAREAWRNGLFKKNTGDDIKTHVRQRPAWLAFYLTPANDLFAHRVWVLSPGDVMDATRLTVYAPLLVKGQESYRKVTDALHSTDRDKMETVVSDFVLPAEADYSRPFFVKVGGKLSMNGPLFLMSSTAAQQDSTTRVALASVLFGILIALLLYNGVLAVLTWGKVYAIYVGYVFVIGVWLAQITGWMAFVSPTFSQFYNSYMTSNLSASLTHVVGFFFVAQFLGLKKIVPRSYEIMGAIVLASCVVGILTTLPALNAYYEDLHRGQFLIALVSTIYTVGVTVYVWRLGQRSAGIFLIAWSFMAASLILFAIGANLELGDTVFPRAYHLLVGAAAESLLLSFALAQRIRDMRRTAEKMARLTITDALTGLYNKRHFDSMLPEVMQEARKDTDKVICLAVDVDHFKAVNDDLGHAAGDKVLKGIGDIIFQQTRRDDFSFRVGGDEFVMLMRSEDMDGIRRVAERIRQQVQKEHFGLGPVAARVTVSIGMARMLPGDSAAAVFERADDALYRSKREGRNRISEAL